MSKKGKIGVTGGIGSGKTTVCKMFEVLGISIYNADDRAKHLMQSDEELINALQRRFGADIFNKGKLERQKLASLVFTNEENLRDLNALVHPKVRQDGLSWHEEQAGPYTIKEAALLFESGAFEDLDFVISVSAPIEVRIKRVMARDGAMFEEVLNRMDNQWPQDKKNELADFVIHNSGEEELIPQVLKIHDQILAHFKGLE